jgi:hypothetical protein
MKADGIFYYGDTPEENAVIWVGLATLLISFVSQ